MSSLLVACTGPATLQTTMDNLWLAPRAQNSEPGEEPNEESKPVEPIKVDGSMPLAFRGVIFKVEPGTAIGGHYDGLLGVRGRTYYWQSGISVASDDFRVVASEEMKEAGYTVMGAENILFGEDESAKARYQLGGTIQSIAYNTYGPLAGGYSQAGISVEWQVYDTLRRKTFFSSVTEGYGEQKGTSAGLLLQAFRMSLRGLLADQQFVSATAKALQPEFVDQTDGRLSIEACKLSRRMSLPKDIESAKQTVVVIRTGLAHGSGVFVSTEGFILTAAHVITGLDSVSIKMASGLELDAAVIRTDDEQDLALLRTRGKGYPCAVLEAKTIPGLGTDIFAIGAPLNEDLALSVSKGVVSGIRDRDGVRYLQTDASLNPGNSGGPLFDGAGGVVAIVSQKIVGLGIEGLSFGIPSNVVADRLGIEWK